MAAINNVIFMEIDEDAHQGHQTDFEAEKLDEEVEVQATKHDTEIVVIIHRHVNVL